MQSRDGIERQKLLFREVNKRIREVSDSFGSDGNVEFLCECGRDGCTATFVLTHAQFDGLLTEPTHFLLASEHRESANGAHVIAEYDEFLVVAADS